MSYLVLARKYRPRRFEDLVGQEVVTGVLRGALSEGRVGHAYLFAGPRGTGKTTTARILAKALNCERGPTADPCGQCDRCQAADEGTELDLIEIDAASNTSVNDVRELRESVGYAPQDARFKVYLVDEVHMLSRAAFNALLKTLEEPPAHVVFLFATTELHKVPDTILSRCQVLRLAPIREEPIAERLRQVFAAEGVEAGSGVVEELARRARGGLRDALSLADQLLALAGTRPEVDDLARLSGGAGLEQLLELLDAVAGGDRAAVIDAVARWVGRESELAGGLLEALRSCLVAGVCGPRSPHLDGGPRVIEALVERARRLGVARLELFLADLLRARERMRLLPGSERVVLEVALLELCQAEATLPLAELVQRLERLESRLAGGAAPSAALAPGPSNSPPPSAPPSAAHSAPRTAPRTARAAAAPEPEAALAPAARRAPPSATPPSATPPSATPPAPAPAPTATPAAPPSSAGAAATFGALLTALEERHGSLAQLLRRVGRLELGSEGARLCTGQLEAPDRALLDDRRNRRAIERCLAAVLGRETSLAFDGPAAAPVRGPTDAFTRHVADLFEGRIEEP
jgi:DNA polymerase-3 subunit gamma/tau